MFNIISDLIGYTGGTNISYSNVVNICGALIVLTFVFFLSFIFEFISTIFHR